MGCIKKLKSNNRMKGIFAALIIMILGLVIWNVFLTQKISNSIEKENDLNLKIEILEGEINVMEYDLITARDSLRILNKIVQEEIEDSIIIYDDYVETSF